MNFAKIQSLFSSASEWNKFALLFMMSCLLYSKLCAGSESEGEFTFGYWQSEGHTQWSHNASGFDSRFGNPTSDLEYTGLKSNIFEIGFFKALNNQQFFRATLGTGKIDDGNLFDGDFFSAEGASFFVATESGAHRFSYTKSDIYGDDIFYFSFEFGNEFDFDSPVFKGKLFGGYQKWEETYVARDILTLECTYSPVCNFVGYFESDPLVITNEVDWEMLYIGFNGQYIIKSDITLEATFTYSPLVSLDNLDTHHHPTTNFQSIMTGDGTGYNANLNLNFKLNESMLLNLGYRVWYREIDSGTLLRLDNFLSFPLNDFNTKREGYVISLTNKF